MLPHLTQDEFQFALKRQPILIYFSVVILQFSRQSGERGRVRITTRFFNMY